MVHGCCSLLQSLSMRVIPWLWILLLSLLSSSTSATNGKDLRCDPCIERPEYYIRAIVHGTRHGTFWQQVRASCVQAAKDLRVNLKMDLYDTFDPNRMARDIRKAATSSNKPDALIVTIPSDVVQDAVKEALQHVPVFGLNSGYHVAEEVGLLGFVAMDEYKGGAEAGMQFLDRRNVTRALYVNPEKGNFALDQRLSGFRDVLRSNTSNVLVDELAVNVSDASIMEGQLVLALDGCPYDTILLGGSSVLESTTSALYANGCVLSEHILGTFDTNTNVYDAIAVGKLAFTISQQQYLQGSMSVLMASIYATTHKNLQRSEIYFSGPAAIHIQNLPSDTLQVCEAEAFPVCPNTMAADGVTPSKCDCTDRSKIKIGGVLHGETTDLFWDIIFAQARQAAQDMDIDLRLDRLEPESSVDVLHAKMAQKMISLCHEGVHGLFVTVPSDLVIPAIQECQALNIPVLSINAGAEAASDLNLIHHIAMLEYSAGYGAGQLLVASGMLEGLCLRHVDLFLLDERCRGFEDAIAETKGNVTYLGKVDVPPDNTALFLNVVEKAAGRDGEWDGIGVMLGGPTVASVGLELKRRHDKLLLGCFGKSDEIYAGLDDNLILFGTDQVPFMQGYMPVPLLTWLVYTKQRLVNTYIETGPTFIEESPSQAQRVCEANYFGVCPEPVDYDFNQLTWVRPVGLTLAGIIFATSICFAVWVVWYKKERVVRASQPMFLFVICVGALIMGASIIPMSIDDGVASTEACDRACIATPWLFTCGFIIMFSALYSKIHRMNRLVAHAKSFRRVKVTVCDVMLPFAMLFSLNVIFMLVWTLMDPMYWERKAISGTGGLSSYGVCALGNTGVSKAMLACVFALLFCALVLANVEACKARQISTEFSESRYVALIMISLLQIAVVVAPLVALVYTNPPPSYFVRSALVFIVCMSVLLLIFVPKVIYLRKSRYKTRSRTSSILNENETRRSWARTSSAGSLGLRFTSATQPDFSLMSKVQRLEQILQERGLETEPLFAQAGFDTSDFNRYQLHSLEPPIHRCPDNADTEGALSNGTENDLIGESGDRGRAVSFAAIDDDGVKESSNDRCSDNADTEAECPNETETDMVGDWNQRNREVAIAQSVDDEVNNIATP